MNNRTRNQLVSHSMDIPFFACPKDTRSNDPRPTTLMNNPFLIRGSGVKLSGSYLFSRDGVMAKSKRYLVRHYLSEDGEDVWTLHYETPKGNAGKILYEIDEEYALLWTRKYGYPVPKELREVAKRVDAEREAEWEAGAEEREAKITRAEDNERRFLESLTEDKREEYEREWEEACLRLPEMIAYSRKWHPERW